MKILPVNTSQNKISYNNDFATYKCARVNNNITFKSVDIYQRILTSPDLSEKFMKLVGQGVAAAAAAILGAAVFKDKDSEKFVDTFIKSNDKNNSVTELENTKDELNKYKAENEALKKIIEDLKSQKEETTLQPSAEKAEPEKIYASFPKKRGRWALPYEKLKTVISKTPLLTQEDADKTTKICEELIKNGTKKINRNEVENFKVALMFAEELAITENKKDIIDKFYRICGFEDKNNDTITTEIPKISVPKVVGKIDLDKLNTGKRKRFVHTVEQEVEIIPQETSKETFIFKLPGTINKNISYNLNILFKNFEKRLFGRYIEGIKTDTVEKPDKPFWKYNKPVPECIRPEDIQKEIYKHNGNGNFKNPSQYKNIPYIKPEFIADLINSDPRYHQLFTIHSALRLIDRYIDFESNVDTEIQSRFILDKLTEIIQNAFKDGARIETYHADYNFTAPRIVIPASNFDSEAEDIFGTMNLKITLCEKQTKFRHIPNYENPEALICTIYSDGM